VPAGDLRQFGYDLPATCAASEVFRRLQDVDGYGGKCGICEFRTVCGGCRARALAAVGDYLAEEPACPYQPTGLAS
jgi:radical SAM protein with 4Fe4S-binding SPASM domain